MNIFVTYFYYILQKIYNNALKIKLDKQLQLYTCKSVNV